jgi:hypothetical protein
MRFILFVLFNLCPYIHCWSQGYHSLVISEIMADPKPVTGLPDVEYLELFNRSETAVSLKNWKLITGSRSVLLPDSIIPPGSYALVCSRANLGAMAPFGNLILLNTFSLTNEGMALALYNHKDQTVYAVTYQNKWWASKRNGGVALEMADTDNPCGEAGNWVVSADPRGGTPGGRNSIVKRNTDYTRPEVERVDVSSNKEIVVVFNKRMDSLSAVSGASVVLSGRSIISKQLKRPLFLHLVLTLDAPLVNGEEYQLAIENIAGCSGEILRESVYELALPSPADSGDIVINEILFNPRDSGVDFVELYNRSAKHISLKNWGIGHVKSDGTSSFNSITSENLLMQPASYLALTSDEMIVKQHYPSSKKRNFLEMISLPSFPDTKGGVVLRDHNMQVLDRLIYDEKMHHELLSDHKGVSLEKIDAKIPSWQASNWHSAAAVNGYATPGYANSQMQQQLEEDIFTVEPEAFTPDGDGHDDFAVVSYKQNASGRIATIRIYTAHGRLVKNLIRNQLIGTGGDIRWDGTDEQGQPVSTGYYFLLIDIFDTAGTIRQFRKKVVVARGDR